MTKIAAMTAAWLGIGTLFPLASTRGGSRWVPAPAPGRAAFLVRFGLDGAEAVDWSGSVSAPGARIKGWQFGPEDEVGTGRWKCFTRRERYWDTPYESSMRPTSTRDKVAAKGVLLEFEGPAPGRVEVATGPGNFAFDTAIPVGGAPRLFLNGRVSVSAVPASVSLAAGPDEPDYPSLLEARDGTLWLAYQSYTEGSGDRVLVRRLDRSGSWSPPEPLTAPGDCFRTAIAQDRAGRIWVVWAARLSGDFDLYGRAFDGQKWSDVRRLTTGQDSDAYHALASDTGGNLYLAYQSARSGNFDIYLKVFDGKDWSREIQVSSTPANEWQPALAVAPNGKVTVLWDTYAKGSYDIAARSFENGKLGPVIPIAETGAFESRVSAQYDRQGRLWIAWDEGDWNWGKDYGYRIPESGRGLLVRRQVRVALLDGSGLSETSQAMAESVPEDFRQVFHQPAVVLDSHGNPWVFYRTRVNLPQQKRPKDPQARALWRLASSTYQDGRWLPMMEFPEGHGRIDLAASVVPRRSGDLAIAWAPDGRQWPSGGARQQDLFFATLPSGPAAGPARLVPYRPPQEKLAPSHPREAQDLQRVRSYRTSAGGRTLRVIRGDTHRHTDVSWDGNRDGSLDDSFRYALDAAGFEFLCVTDHGQWTPYNWWRVQKSADLFTIRGRFAPLYSYERSLSYPNGHRNVLFTERGRPHLPASEAERRGEEGAGKLYQYLRELGGIVISHTSASGMGTDWRDSDAELEPVVEIYQGYRSNSETDGAPRAPTAQESGKYAAGFIWNAWAKGIKLGTLASSDHVSTHISYAGLFVDAITREAVIAAMKRRRSFAATDNIFIETRMGDRFMGDRFAARSPAPLTVYVSGTAPAARVDVIKSNRIVYSLSGAGPEVRFTYTDNDPKPGEAFYYVRVEQEDGQLCWSSPIWVEYQ